MLYSSISKEYGIIFGVGATKVLKLQKRILHIISGVSKHTS
jgi:hypothetical protein